VEDVGAIAANDDVVAAAARDRVRPVAAQNEDRCEAVDLHVVRAVPGVDDDVAAATQDVVRIGERPVGQQNLHGLPVQGHAGRAVCRRFDIVIARGAEHLEVLAHDGGGTNGDVDGLRRGSPAAVGGRDGETGGTVIHTRA